MEDTFSLERAMDFAVCSRDDADMVGKDHDRIEPRLVWGGRASVRRILYMATVTALRYNPAILTVYFAYCVSGVTSERWPSWPPCASCSSS